MTLQAFIDKYTGKTVGYPSGSYVGECLSIVKVYIKEVFGFNPPPSGSNSAYGYWSNFPSPLPIYFEKVGNTKTNIPKVGDIIIWDTNAGNGDGHIAIVVGADVNSFISFEQNWGGKHSHIQAHDYKNVVGWLTPKEIMSDCLLTNSEEDKKTFEGLVTKSTGFDELLKVLVATTLEGAKSTIGGFRARITDLGNQLGEALAEMKNRTEQVSRLKQQVTEVTQQRDLFDAQLKSKQEELNEFAKAKGLLEIENSKLQVQVNTLKQAQTEGSITLTIKDLLNLILNQKITIRR